MVQLLMLRGSNEDRSLGGIAERLRTTRLAFDLSQAEFAAQAGLRRNTYNQYEKARGRPQLDHALQIVDTYGVTLDWIYRGEISGLSHQLAVKIQAVISQNESTQAASKVAARRA